MTNLKSKKLEKKQRVSFMVLLILIILGAILFLKINFYISTCFLAIGVGVVYIEYLNRKIMKELEE